MTFVDQGPTKKRSPSFNKDEEGIKDHGSVTLQRNNEGNSDLRNPAGNNGVRQNKAMLLAKASERLKIKSEERTAGPEMNSKTDVQRSHTQVHESQKEKSSVSRSQTQVHESEKEISSVSRSQTQVHESQKEKSSVSRSQTQVHEPQKQKSSVSRSQIQMYESQKEKSSVSRSQTQVHEPQKEKSSVSRSQTQVHESQKEKSSVSRSQTQVHGSLKETRSRSRSQTQIHEAQKEKSSASGSRSIANLQETQMLTTAETRSHAKNTALASHNRGVQSNSIHMDTHPNKIQGAVTETTTAELAREGTYTEDTTIKQRTSTPAVTPRASTYKSSARTTINTSGNENSQTVDQRKNTNLPEARNLSRLALSTPKMNTAVINGDLNRQKTNSKDKASDGRLTRQKTTSVTADGRLTRQTTKSVTANGRLTRQITKPITNETTDESLKLNDEMNPDNKNNDSLLDDNDGELPQKDKLTITALNLIAENKSISISEDKSPTNYRCIMCDMIFKTKAQLTYHKSELCIGDILIRDDILSSLQTETHNHDTPMIGNEFPRFSVTPREDGRKYPKLHWDRCFNGFVPEFAVKAGFDFNSNCEVYVCRAKFQNALIPGKVIPNQKCAYITMDGNEIMVTDYEVLTDPHDLLTWKSCDTLGGIPRGSQKGGYDSSNMTYFVTRATTPDGCLCSGKYVPQERKCYFPWGGQEHAATSFEFICKK